MQGVERTDRELLDAAALVGHLVPEGSMFAFLAAHRRDLFPDKDFADLFPSDRGRRSMPGSVAASILTLQTLLDLSDAEVAEAARCDLRWKVACGMALDHKGFHPSTLTYWRQRLTRSSRPQRITDAVQQVLEATALLAALGEVKPDESAQQALALLALVAGQDVEPAEGSDGTDGRWRIAGKVAEDRVVSTVDPDARHTRKSPEARRDGYRAHVAADPDTGIITDEELTKAAGTENSDPAVAERFLAADIATSPDRADDQPDSDAHTPMRREWYGDSAYGTGDLRGAFDDAGHTAVIKPKPLQSPVEGGLTVDDFTVDEDNQTVTCPAGSTRPISATRIATFGALCRDCPLRQRCTTSKTGRKIVLHERDDLLRQARRDWKDNSDLRERYRRHRPNIERVVSQIASRGGRRLKLRYRGTTLNNAWLKRRTAALNLRNLIARGLTHTLTGWALTTA